MTAPDQPVTVAISRQRGSGGAYVGRAIAERLGFLYVDREMLHDAAEYLFTQDAPPRTDAADSSWWSQIARTFALGSADSGYAPPPSESIYEGDLFERQTRLVREIVEGQRAVIVGRGAAQTLRGRPHVLSVFLHSPEPWRIERVQQVYAVTDRRVAERMVHESDRDRSQFITAAAGVEWTDVRSYDLAIDTAALGLDAAIDIIIRAAHGWTAGDLAPAAPSPALKR